MRHWKIKNYLSFLHPIILVIKTDKVLTELEVPHQLMATPPELYDMCGLSIEIDPSIVEQVKVILKEHKISTSGLFLV